FRSERALCPTISPQNTSIHIGWFGHAWRPPGQRLPGSKRISTTSTELPVVLPNSWPSVPPSLQYRAFGDRSAAARFADISRKRPGPSRYPPTTVGNGDATASRANGLRFYRLKGQRSSGYRTRSCGSTLLHLARIAHHHLREGCGRSTRYH